MMFEVPNAPIETAKRMAAEVTIRPTTATPLLIASSSVAPRQPCLPYAAEQKHPVVEIHASHLDWTILRPPRLTGEPAAGTYRTTIDRNLPRGYTISRADLAACMLTLLDDPATGHRHVSIAN